MIKKSQADIAYEYIKNGVISKQFFPGNRLIEEEIVRDTGVSRTSVRTALTRLRSLANNGGNTTIAACSVLGYDAYFVALEAMKKAGSIDKDAIKATLPSVEYDGVTGHIAFDENGDAIRDSAFVKHLNTESGEYELFGEQKVKD